jgi:hypothetical protein
MLRAFQRERDHTHRDSREGDVRRTATARILVAEVISSARATAIFTSLANAMASETNVAILGAPAAYVPTDCGVTRRLLTGPLATELPWSAVSLAHQMCDRLALAQSITRTALNDANPDWKKLSAVWRQIASGLLVALYDLDRIHDAESLGAMDADVQPVLRALADARGGGTPYVSSSGALFIPGVVDWRSGAREEQRIGVEVQTQMFRTRALVTDLSATGLGLADVDGLATGEPVTLRLDDGQSFDGFVAWTRQRRAGIAFALKTVRPQTSGGATMEQLEP